MKESLQKIREAALTNLQEINDLKVLEELRLKFLGKKGELTQVLKEMGKLRAEERPEMGQLANDVRSFIEEKLDDAKNALLAKEQEMKLSIEKIDVTMPGKKAVLGHKHPMTIVVDEIKDIFIGMGYEIADGPEIETDYYNFEALNIYDNHPAKDEQDTF